MSKDFARKLIEQPGDETTNQLFKQRIAGVFWVDWREADDAIIAMVATAIDGRAGGTPGEPAAKWVDSKLHIRFGGTLTLVQLAGKPGEQDVTLLALNRALAPNCEIRFIKASDGGDTLAFMVMCADDWTALDAEYGQKIDAAFGRIAAGSALFAQDSPPAPADPAVTVSMRPSLALARIKEGRALATQQKYAEAVAIFDDVVRLYGNDAEQRVQLRVLMALVSKGIALADQNKPREAIEAYDEADRRFGNHTDVSSRDLVSSALFNKSLCLRALGQFADEIAVAMEIDRRFGADTDPAIRTTVISAMRNHAFRLGALDKLPQQTEVYDAIVQRFGGDTEPAIRAEVALARNGAAYSRMMMAKQNWAEREARTGLLRAAVEHLRRALESCEENRRVMILGNLGYALFLAGDEMAAARETQECLRLGGKDALAGQRADAATFRVAPDAEYEDMLKRLWAKLAAA